MEVAYGPEPSEGRHPSIGVLEAFRVTGRLPLALDGTIPEPKVTVQPTFEVYVESVSYPAGALDRLTPLGNILSEDKATVLKLDRRKVAARAAEDPDFDAVSLLTRLAGRELPRNVKFELESWVKAADTFTLYEGFALLEGDEALPAADPFTHERVAPGIRIVHSPDQLFAELEKAELVPLKIAHADSELRPAPAKSRTAFPKAGTKGAARPAKKETVKRRTTVTLHLPDRDLFEKLRNALSDAGCPVEEDGKNLTLEYSKNYDKEAAKAMKSLAKEFAIRIEEIE